MAENDPTWFDAINALIRCPSNHTNRIHLTWEIVESSRFNMFHSLYTPHYDDSAFLGLLRIARQTCPDSIEFQIAFAFAGIASGQFSNGLRQLASIELDSRTPKSYASVLRRICELWTGEKLSSSLQGLGHNHSDRAVNFDWNIPTGWLGKPDCVNEFC